MGDVEPQASVRAKRLGPKELAIDLFRRALREQATPPKIGWSVGVGVFCACTPPIGLHMWMALGMATLLRLNRLWAFVGSRASLGPVFAGIVFCEIQSAHRLRTGVWASVAPANALAQGRELLVDWVAGTAIVGSVLGALAGTVVYLWVATRADRVGGQRQGPVATLTPRTPDEPLLPSSGSPPSARPDPTR